MCERQETKKYTSRKSPPYPANECKGTEKIGNDGKMYISVGNKNGVHRWVLKESKSPKTSLKSKSPKGVCKPDQIINPATGRCVLKTGPVGKKLLGFESPTKKSPTKSKSPTKNPLESLKKLKSEFNQIAIKYSKYGLNDSEAFTALMRGIEGTNVDDLYWGLFPEYNKNRTALTGYAAIIKKAKEIFAFVKKNGSNEEVSKYLKETRNLRYDY